MSTSDLSGPPAPGQTTAGPFAPTESGFPKAINRNPFLAWASLVKALGKDFQRGLHDAEKSRRRLARNRPSRTGRR